MWCERKGRFLAVFMTLLLSLSAQATEQSLFYNLHQAVNLLEQKTIKKCKIKNKIKKVLIKADKELGEVLLKNKSYESHLSQLLQEAWKTFNSSDAKRWQVEDLRLKLHESGEKMKLNHSKSWYLEVKNCGAGYN